MKRQRLLMVIGIALVAQVAFANKLVVTNTCLQSGGVGYTFIQTDVSWKNSWRATWSEGAETYTNWDAAWIFVKFRYQGGAWQHASLDITNGNHLAAGPVGATFSVGLSTNAGGTNFGCGVFLYRSADGSGNWTNTIKLRWNYLQDGVLSTSRVDVCVNAIEMVYVPQGSFYVGDGTAANIAGQFCSNTTGTVAFRITNENYEITLGGGGEGSLGNNNATGMATADDFNNATPQTLPAAFPKGYNAFYCMKYEISQGQWVSFFNMLSDSGNQKKSNDLNVGRDITGGTPNNQGKGSDDEVNRNTVSWLGIGNDATCTTPNRACNFLSWADVAAYADWAGLRPMTELEFEKACRGPLASVANEYAWGAPTIIADSGDGTINLTVPEDGTETNKTSVALGAAVYGDNNIYTNGVSSGKGPVRCGLFATATSTRITAGATYWGVMEMSGNVWERAVTVGNVNGRAFTGGVGDGKLDATTGNATADFWPGTGTIGAGFRGGNWNVSTFDLRLASRHYAVNVDFYRYYSLGGRAVRQASSVVE